MKKSLSWVHLSWLAIFLAVFIWSAIEPKDTLTWFLEVFPAVAGLAMLAYTFYRFPLTPLLYQLILLHCIILMVGGHYTYAEVPFFDWLQEAFNGSRNNYDKVGHFFQGLVPVLIAREILIRKKVVIGRFWQNFISVSIALAFSAFYELIEWWVALLSGEEAQAFLGTQGYIWDTQSDMGFALLGAVLGVVLLARRHDKQIQTLLH